MEHYCKVIRRFLNYARCIQFNRILDTFLPHRPVLASGSFCDDARGDHVKELLAEESSDDCGPVPGGQ